MLMTSRNWNRELANDAEWLLFFVVIGRTSRQCAVKCGNLSEFRAGRHFYLPGIDSQNFRFRFYGPEVFKTPGNLLSCPKIVFAHSLATVQIYYALEL